jgi:hypothetical protein
MSLKTEQEKQTIEGIVRDAVEGSSVDCQLEVKHE